MKKVVCALAAAWALLALFCSPPPATHGVSGAEESVFTAAGAGDDGAVPVKDDPSVAVILPDGEAAVARVQDGERVPDAPAFNDTAVVRLILNECGLAVVEVEQVTVWDSAGRAIALDLSNNDLSTDGITFLPAAVSDLTELRSLSAKNNSIDAIPLEIFRLKNLVKLDLASNKISFIPSAISELENLETLDLRYNGFGYLPSEIGNLKKLVSLQLWGNRMVELEPAVTRLPSLKELYLKNNRLTSLPEEITRMKTLVYFDLQGNAICNPSPAIDAWLKKNDKRYREAQRCR